MNSITREEFPPLLEAAGIKLRLKRELRFVPEKIEQWQDLDFIAVMNRSKTEGVIIAELDKMYIVPFRLQKRTANRMGRVEAVICDICATWQRGSTSAVISFSKEKGSVSFLCCADLLCSLHIRDKTPASTLSRVQLRETISSSQRSSRLKERLQSILQEL